MIQIEKAILYSPFAVRKTFIHIKLEIIFIKQSQVKP